MQVAKLFASLGFKVDLSGYNTFEQKLKDVRKETRSYAVSLKTIRTRLNSVGTALDGVNKKLDASKVKQSNQRISTSAHRLANAVERSNKGITDVIASGHRLHTVISQINTILGRGVGGWQRYNAQLTQAQSTIRSIDASLRGLPSNRTININQRNSGGHGNGGGSSSSRNGSSFGAGMGGGAIGSIWGSGREFMRSISPATAIAGGLATAGWATKEVVQRGREQQKMENVLMFSSKTDDNMKDFNDSLQFVQKSALELGTTSQELGKAFAQVNMSAGDTLSKDEKKSLFMDMSKSFVTMGATKDEQFLLYKAVNQMFSLGRIQAEEMNQLTGQGLVPRKLVYDAVKEVYGVKTNEEVQALQKANKLDPAKIMPHVFGAMSQQADESGAFEKYKGSSLYQQNVMMEQINQMSKRIMDNGLDKILAKLFASINAGLPALERFAMLIVNGAEGVYRLVGAVKKLIVENWKLVAGFVAVRGILHLLRGGIWGVGSTSLLMAGAFGKAMAFMWVMAKRFAPIAILLALFKFGEDYNAYLKGDDNWISTFGLMFQILFMKVELYSLRIKMALMDIMDFGRKTFDFFKPNNTFMQGITQGILQFSSNIGVGSKPSNPDFGLSQYGASATNKNTVPTTINIMTKSPNGDFQTQTFNQDIVVGGLINI